MNNKRLASEAMNEYALESAFARHLIDPARPEGAEGPCSVSYTHLTLPTNREV